MTKLLKLNTFLLLAILSTITLTMTSCNDEQPKQNIQKDTAIIQNFDNTQLLQKYFKQQNYTWPIGTPEQIPDILLETMPKDLKQLSSIKTKKTLFIQILLPLVFAEQQHILKKRKRVIQLIEQSGNKISVESNPWFASLINEYRINKSLDSSTQKQLLLKRIDSLPTELVIAQAAIESGWGTSRFALEGNSLFGEWTFEKQAGLIPNDRHSKKTHQVKKFESLQLSIRSYIKNINRNNAYKELRNARFEMRKNDRKLDALELAKYLHRYSQKGEDYVKSLQQLMKSAELTIISKLNLNDDSTFPSS